MVEEMAAGFACKGMDSLEEKVSVFFYEGSDESNRSFEDEEEEEYESDSKNLHDPVERTIYWESQEALIQELLDRYSLTGSKLRQEVIRIIGVAKKTDFCSCLDPKFKGCINCLRRKVVNLLCQRGLHASLCTSTWKNTKKFPGGKHEYIELMANTSGGKKQVPYLIELEFRDQFKIAKACDEYHKLVDLLPEYYIGKDKYLNATIGVVCDAAQRSMKEKKIHMGPWRKRSFMQMKWSMKEKVVDDEPSKKLPEQENESCLQFHAAPAVIVI